ncbi:MAG: LysE family transporter [Rhizobiaceae bacterium]|nr:LysE family transporter [Rhizobiaceae bacterium]
MPELFLSLMTFAIIATISPGGATTLATASGVQFGLVRSIPLICGIAFGLALLNGAVGGGLGGLINTFPQIQLALKVFGSTYLLWLAWTIGKQGAPKSSGDADTPIGFLKGLLLLWLNPKGWTMAVSAAAAFASLSDSPQRLAILLGTVFGTAALLSLSLWCIGGQWLSLFLKTEQQWRYVNIALGLLLAISIIPMWR